MILKAKERGDAAQLAHYLLDQRDNDHVELHEVRGFVSDDLIDAFGEAHAIAQGTRCDNYMFSMSFNPPEGENVTVEAFEEAIDQVEEKLGLQGQPRAVVFHEKDGRRHAHAVWTRIDANRMRSINMNHYKAKLRDVSRELFIEHGWNMPRGLACTCCEAFAQAELPSRPIARGRPGPGLLAHVLVGKYCDHLPLYRQSEIYARDKVDLHRSTLTDWVGRTTALLEPLAAHIGKLVRAGPALFADDTPVKMQAKGKAQTARLWSYVRDERPWCGQAPPCVWYQFSVDRKGEHPSSHLKGYKGVIHADGFTGFNGLFGADRASEQACMVHVRRKFVDIYESEGSAIAEETIKRIAALYAVEKEARYQPIDGKRPVNQDCP